MKHFGYLSIQVVNAGGALPIDNALVKIESADEYDRIETQTALTDYDGKTEVFALPAPASVYSLTPTPKEAPYALYRVSVFKEGYYIRSIENVFLFENIYTTLTVPLIPNSLYNPNRNRPTMPSQENEVII